MPKPAAETTASAAEILALASGNSILLRVTRVQTPTAEMITAEQKARIREQLQNTTASHEFAALEAMLQANARISRKQTVSSN